MEQVRKCIACGEEIKECMGFVLARDIVNKRNPIREICGKCGLEILDMDEKKLNGKVAEWLKALPC
jgi:hypothetical protein